MSKSYGRSSSPESPSPRRSPRRTPSPRRNQSPRQPVDQQEQNQIHGESKGVDEDYDMKGIEKRKAIANIIKLKNESFKTTLFEATIALLNVVGKLKEISEKISEMTSETTSEMGSFLLLFKTTAAEALLKGVAKLDVIVEQYENEIETHNQDLINLLFN